MTLSPVSCALRRSKTITSEVTVFALSLLYAATMNGFAQQLRNWRRERRYSQLGLATEASISPRHLSFLESERARPSRDMVLRLAEALELPRHATNSILGAAGFAPHFQQTPLDADALSPVREALERVMDNHAPYPAVLMDREWTILRLNSTAQALFAPAGIGVGSTGFAILDLPGGPAAWVENWPEVGHHLLTRLQAEIRALGGNPKLERAAARLRRDASVEGHMARTPPPAVIPTIYKAGPMRLSLFSTFLQIGGVEDITLADLRVELMFPMDTATKETLENLGKGIG